MKSYPRILFVVCIMLFVILFYTGIRVAENKILWNDEIYSQVVNVSGKSYLQIIKGSIGEGNICPLFYLLQKAVCDVSGFRLPEEWKKGDWGFTDRANQIHLRILPVFFISLSVTAIFFYFSYSFSLLMGIYSLALSLSSKMVWYHWAEARPYAVWFFLTAVQFIFFLMLVKRKGEPGNLWHALTAVHILLSLTVVFSVAQVSVISLLLWLTSDRHFKKYILITFVPIAAAGVYYFFAPKFPFHFSLTPDQLIRECFSRDRIYILIIYALFAGLYYAQNKFGFPRLYKDRSILSALPCWSAALLSLLGAVLIILAFRLFFSQSNAAAGFAITPRYFIFLTPVGIISMAVVSSGIIRSLYSARWLQVIAFLGTSYFVIHRIIKTIPVVREMTGLNF